MTTKLKSRATQEHGINAVPRGFHSLTPGLTVSDVEKAIEFYKAAFHAEERYRMPGSDNKTIIHAELQIGDSVILLGVENDERGIRSPRSYKGTPVSLNLYVRDVDEFFARAVDLGARSLKPVENAFWGDRYGRLEDPFGHVWGICTRVEDLSPEEVTRRGQEFLARMKASKS
jgi:uncharacterized glyoxalase superfamily protein PhnB